MPDRIVELEQELFHACLELTPPDQDAYLEQACREDAPLRRRIERLLAAHRNASESEDVMEDRIGPYRLIRVLGEGGMGVVYEADQLEPVRRRVALKIVKPGMDTRRVVARFMMERQAVAALDHPYVAKVFDAGCTVAGRPYFAMELVDGIPLLDYCEQERLTIRSRIELFVMICHAVQHAHQKGVIHRDLKPTNVLVISSSSRPLPKVIDFGIAKAVTPGSAELAATMTYAGQALGTPAYMSPEQAGRNGLDIDTRTDVYSLGVILYQILTGSLPLDPGETTYPEFLARLTRGELLHPRPSARVRELRGDLDWIVLKALEVDRDRRYESPMALAADLERYLGGRPVSARPLTARYRFGKFVRRHRIPVAAACLSIAGLAGGAVAAGVGFVRASRAEASARQEAATAQEVSGFLTRLFGAADPKRAPGSATTVREVLDRGAQKAENELSGQPRVQVDLLATLSHVYESLGLYREARKLAQKSLAVAQAAHLKEDLKTADALFALGRVDQRLGEFEEARRSLQHALELRQRFLGENHPLVGVTLNNLGALYGQLEKFDSALDAHRRALAIQRRATGPERIRIFNSLRGIGIVHERKGEWTAALESFREAQAVLEKMRGPDDPAIGGILNDCGRMLRRLKRLDEARVSLERAMQIRKRALGPNHAEIAFDCVGLGRVLEDQGNLDEALALYREGIRIRVAALGPDNLRTGEAIEREALLRLRRGENADGRRLLERSLRIYLAAYGPDHSDTLECRKELAIALVKAGKLQEALPHLEGLVLRTKPSRVSVDLRDPVFEPMRSLPAFLDLLLRQPARTS